jgi:hypothetical protein
VGLELSYRLVHLVDSGNARAEALTACALMVARLTRLVGALVFSCPAPIGVPHRLDSTAHRFLHCTAGIFDLRQATAV